MYIIDRKSYKELLSIFGKVKRRHSVIRDSVILPTSIQASLFSPSHVIIYSLHVCVSPYYLADVE